MVTGFSAPSFHFTDGLTEAKTGPCTKSLHSEEEGQGWKPGKQSLSQPCWAVPHPMPGTSWAHGQDWLGECQGRICGPGTMTQLTSGAINTSACPTAPTCPTGLPFSPMNGPGARGQDAWVCAQNITKSDLAQGPLSTSGSHSEL